MALDPGLDPGGALWLYSDPGVALLDPGAALGLPLDPGAALCLDSDPGVALGPHLDPRAVPGRRLDLRLALDPDSDPGAALYRPPPCRSMYPTSTSASGGRLLRVRVRGGVWGGEGVS